MSWGVDWKFGIYCLTSLLAVLNPIGSLPIYLSLTGDRTLAEARQTAVVTSTAVFATLTVFALFGERILAFFGIGLPAFRAGGGILLLMMAISMLQARVSGVKQTKSEASESAEREAIAIVPLAIPILAGPGSISTVIILSHRAQAWQQSLTLFLVIVLTGLLVYGLFRMGQHLRNNLGIVGLNIITRLMGLILAALAVQFITEGLGQLLPGLTTTSG